MLIKCPHCGTRPSEEFTFLGDARVKRPTSNDPATMDQWFDYVYLRDNPKGRFDEYCASFRRLPRLAGGDAQYADA